MKHMDICVLLCTYNGEKYIRRQLDSVLAQTGVNVSFLIHDDGSTDGTLSILGEYGLESSVGGHLGPAHGFLELAANAPDADLYAFCDQDDVWDSDKLKSAADMIAGAEGPALYCCSTRLVEDETFIADHILDTGRSLSARLFYAGISGNTIVFNRALKEHLAEHLPEDLIMHDSWLVKLCIASGGRFVIDPAAHISYRMHGSNEVGMELNILQKAGKFRRIVSGKGEASELIDICALYGSLILPRFREMAARAAESRTDRSARRGFMKEFGIDFNNTAFNAAFALKVRKGNL